MKLLVNSPSGAQELLEVAEGGGYFDQARVLWDERIDGPMPEITLGGMIRDGAELVLDAALLSASEALAIESRKQSLIARIDADVDAIYGAVIGQRATEYMESEAQALAYVAADYAAPVPAYVQDWASASEQDARWAADDIIAIAAAWRAAQAILRTRRLAAKQAVRVAADDGALVATQAEWVDFIAGLRLQLELAGH